MCVLQVILWPWMVSSGDAALGARVSSGGGLVEPMGVNQDSPWVGVRCSGRIVPSTYVALLTAAYLQPSDGRPPTVRTWTTCGCSRNYRAVSPLHRAYPISTWFWLKKKRNLLNPKSFQKNLDVSGCSIFYVNEPKNYVYLAANPHSTLCCPQGPQRFELKTFHFKKIYIQRFETHFHDFSKMADLQSS